MKAIAASGFLLFCALNVFSGTPSDEKRKNNLELAGVIGIVSGLPKGMGESTAWEESRGYENAIGKNNIDEFCSFGLFQINETCEKELADRYLPGGFALYDRFNPEHSAIIGCRYLAALHRKYGNWKEALCAYNWGPGNVDKVENYANIPLKTRKYAENIIGRIRVKPHNYFPIAHKEMASRNSFDRIMYEAIEPKNKVCIIQKRFYLI